jgi:predicted nucleic acid-binding protein
VLFDTNVLLDVLLDRRPFSLVAARLFGRVERRRLHGLIGATAVTTVHYLVTKAAGKRMARRTVRQLLSLFEVAPVDAAVLELAVKSLIDDFEDGVLHEAGRIAGAEALVTRDPRGFRAAQLRVYEPVELEAALAAAEAAPTAE